MFTLTTSDVQRITVSATGALLLTATCLFTAAGPVRQAPAPRLVPVAATAGATVTAASRTPVTFSQAGPPA